MASKTPADAEDDTLELTPDMEADDAPEDEPEDEEGEPEGDEDEGQPAAPEEGEEDGPDLPAFDDEGEAGDGNSVIRGLRERNKQLARELAESRAAIPPPPELQLPERPTLAGCDYDEDRLDEALTEWHETKRKIDDNRAEQARLADIATREWRDDMEGFNTRRAALALDDFDDAAQTVSASLNLAQQAVIVKAAADSAAFIYALGRSDARLAELAKIQDPIKFAAAVARMEGGIKVVKKRKAPAPDRAASGSARMPGGVDKQLEKLEAEAERTGDRTALIAYRKRLKARGK